MYDLLLCSCQADGVEGETVVLSVDLFERFQLPPPRGGGGGI